MHFTVQFYINLCLQPLDEANLAELKVALKGFLQKGETIKLETKVLIFILWIKILLILK